MPRTPILARRGFYSKINRNLGDVRLLDCNFVDTEFGVCVEPRAMPLAGYDGKITQIDMRDAGFDSLSEKSQDSFMQDAGGVTFVQQLLMDFDY